MDLALYKVLINEDDYLIAEDLCSVCEEAQCLLIGPALSGADELEIVRNEIPDIAIVDLDRGEGITMRDLEDVPYLQKPVGRDALLKILNDVLN